MNARAFGGTRGSFVVLVGSAVVLAACSSATPSDRDPSDAVRLSAPIAESPPPAPTAHDAHHGMPANKIVWHPIENADLTDWKSRHPVAASELGEWAQSYPAVHARLCEWDDSQSDRVKVLTDWAAFHPYDDLDTFLMTRHAFWGPLTVMLENPQLREGIEAFVAWTRRNRDAALELVAHPRGLHWAGDHVVSAASGSLLRR